jgi:hypothetical protein
LIKNHNNNNDKNDQHIQRKKIRIKATSPLSCLLGPLGKLLRKVINGVDECIENIKKENDGNYANNAKTVDCITHQSDDIVYHNPKEHGNKRKSVNLNREETFLQFHGIAVEFTDLDEKQCKKSYLASKLYHFYPIWHIGRGLCIIIGECEGVCVYVCMYVCECV